MEHSIRVPRFAGDVWAPGYNWLITVKRAIWKSPNASRWLPELIQGYYRAKWIRARFNRGIVDSAHLLSAGRRGTCTATLPTGSGEFSKPRASLPPASAARRCAWKVGNLTPYLLQTLYPLAHVPRQCAEARPGPSAPGMKHDMSLHLSHSLPT